MKIAASHPYVARVKGVCGGQPVVKGTRVPVRIIAECWRSGMSPEEIRESYPDLGLAQIFDALSYAEDHTEEIEHLLREDKAEYRAGAGRQAKRVRAAKV
jgi:uncharacterized protein (DUF433 family)